MKYMKRCQTGIPELKKSIEFIHCRNNQWKNRMSDIEDKILITKKKIWKVYPEASTWQEEDQSMTKKG